MDLRIVHLLVTTQKAVSSEGLALISVRDTNDPALPKIHVAPGGFTMKCGIRLSVIIAIGVSLSSQAPVLAHGGGHGGAGHMGGGHIGGGHMGGGHVGGGHVGHYG